MRGTVSEVSATLVLRMIPGVVFRDETPVFVRPKTRRAIQGQYFGIRNAAWRRKVIPASADFPFPGKENQNIATGSTRPMVFAKAILTASAIPRYRSLAKIPESLLKFCSWFALDRGDLSVLRNNGLIYQI